MEDKGLPQGLFNGNWKAEKRKWKKRGYNSLLSCQTDPAQLLPVLLQQNNSLEKSEMQTIEKWYHVERARITVQLQEIQQDLADLNAQLDQRRDKLAYLTASLMQEKERLEALEHDLIAALKTLKEVREKRLWGKKESDSGENGKAGDSSLGHKENPLLKKRLARLELLHETLFHIQPLVKGMQHWGFQKGEARLLIIFGLLMVCIAGWLFSPIWQEIYVYFQQQSLDSSFLPMGPLFGMLLSTGIAGIAFAYVSMLVCPRWTRLIAASLDFSETKPSKWLAINWELGLLFFLLLGSATLNLLGFFPENTFWALCFLTVLLAGFLFAYGLKVINLLNRAKRLQKQLDRMERAMTKMDKRSQSKLKQKLVDPLAKSWQKFHKTLIRQEQVHLSNSIWSKKQASKTFFPISKVDAHLYPDLIKSIDVLEKHIAESCRGIQESESQIREMKGNQDHEYQHILKEKERLHQAREGLNRSFQELFQTSQEKENQVRLKWQWQNQWMQEGFQAGAYFHGNTSSLN